MGRGLTTLGALLLLATVTLWVGDAVGFAPVSGGEAWSSHMMKAGLSLLAVGLLLRVASPVAHQLHQAHCVVCGHPVERGKTYCRDHLQETVNSYRDQTREGVLRRTKPRV